MSGSTDFKIVKITGLDCNRVLQYMRQYFYTEEPLNKCLNLERNETVVPISRGANAENAIKEGLSLMAVTPLNEIIGVAINKTIKRDGGREARCDEDHPNFIKISKFFIEFEKQVGDLIKLKSEDEKEMSIFMISVHPNWRNKGIGNALLERSIDIAKQENFSQIQSSCTSIYSAHMFQKFGFYCASAIKYEDYKEDGKVVFKPETPHTELKLMVLRF